MNESTSNKKEIQYPVLTHYDNRFCGERHLIPGASAFAARVKF